MKRMFDDEFSMDEVRNYLKNLQKKDDNNLIAVVAVIGIIVLIAAAVVAVIKLADRAECEIDEDEDFAEGFCDEDGCYYASEEDFE